MFCQACGSLWLTCVPAKAWDLPALRHSDEHDAATIQSVFETFNELWQRQCLLTLQFLWRWRCGLHDPDNKWSAAQAMALQAAGAKAAIQAMIDYQHSLPAATRVLQLLTELRVWEATPRTPPPQEPREGRYILFFDGGSRGNPGPGGSGAVIVSTDALGSTATIVWAAAMSYKQSSMTNNRAEYLGAIAGLRAAVHHKWRPLDVVGDSALILRQLREYRVPKNTMLRPLYARARVAADKLSVTRWTHHFRVHNKMADAAANIAMDARASTQVLFPTTRPEFRVFTEHLAGDFHQWQVGSQDWLHSHDQDLSFDSSS